MVRLIFLWWRTIRRHYCLLLNHQSQIHAFQSLLCIGFFKCSIYKLIECRFCGGINNIFDRRHRCFHISISDGDISVSVLRPESLFLDFLADFISSAAFKSFSYYRSTCWFWITASSYFGTNFFLLVFWTVFFKFSLTFFFLLFSASEDLRRLLFIFKSSSSFSCFWISCDPLSF